MRYDIYLEPSNTERKPFGFGYVQAMKVTGSTKVAQRFLKHLLTPSGSDLSGDVPGTRFPDLVAGNILDQGYIRAEIAMAVDFAANQLIALDAEPGALADGSPGLRSAEVTQVVFTTDGFDAYLRITTTNGAVARLLIPGSSGTAPTYVSTLPGYGELLQTLG